MECKRPRRAKTILKKSNKEAYLQNRNRLTDVENRPVVTKGGGWGWGRDWEFGISGCKQLYIEWINNKVLLYSTGNYIQYPVINHNGSTQSLSNYQWHFSQN